MKTTIQIKRFKDINEAANPPAPDKKKLSHLDKSHADYLQTLTNLWQPNNYPQLNKATGGQILMVLALLLKLHGVGPEMIVQDLNNLKTKGAKLTLQKVESCFMQNYNLVILELKDLYQKVIGHPR